MVEKDNNRRISEYDWALEVIKILGINSYHQQQIKHANMSEELLAKFEAEEKELCDQYDRMHVGITKAKAGREAFSKRLSENCWAGVPEAQFIGPDLNGVQLNLTWRKRPGWT